MSASNDSASNNENGAAELSGEEREGSSVAAASRFNPIRVQRLALKELREILRDRRTIITLVLMPLLVYPLMGVTFQKFLLGSLRSGSDLYYLIGTVDTPQGEILNDWLVLGDQLLKAKEPKAADSDDNNAVQSLMPSGIEDIDLRIEPLESDRAALEQAVAEGRIDVAVMVDFDRNRRPKVAPKFEIIFDEQSAAGKATRDEINRRVAVVNEHWTRELLETRGIPVFIAETREHYLSSSAKTFSLVTFVPLMLVLMTITGAVYPAIDLTAGERERGTLEILIAAPVPRLSLLFGKFVAVLCVAMLTAFVNLTGMFATVYTLGLDTMIFGPDGISLSVILQIVLLLMVFAAFFSALMLGLTSCARSFKEAQSYLIPLMLVALAPGLLSLMPDLGLSATLAVVPLANIVLSARDLLTGELVPAMLAITLISTGFYGLLALTLAARVFGTDSILYGSDGSWSDLFRRPEVRGLSPSMSTATLCLALLFPLFIIAGGIVSRLGGSIERQLAFNALVTMLLFVSLPWLFTFGSNLQIRSVFFLCRPKFASFLIAALLGCTLWIIAYEIAVFTLPSENIAVLKEAFARIKVDFAAVPLPIKLFALAAVPAICEEFFFRGFLLSAFLRESKPLTAVLGSAALFGLFHVIVRDSLTFQRFLPSAMMGVALGYVCWRTGSLLPGILMHMLHNGLLVSLSHFETELKELSFNVEEGMHLPLPIIAGAIVAGIIGFAILHWLHRSPPGSRPVNDAGESSPLA